MYKHKRLLKLVDLHVCDDDEIEGKLIDPALKKGQFGRSRAEGKLRWILLSASGHGYLIEGVSRPQVHVAILSGHGDIGQIGCMDCPDDSDLKHSLKEDPGCLLQIIDKAACSVCKGDL